MDTTALVTTVYGKFLGIDKIDRGSTKKFPKIILGFSTTKTRYYRLETSLLVIPIRE